MFGITDFTQFLKWSWRQNTSRAERKFVSSLRATSGGGGTPPDLGLNAKKYHNKLRILLNSLARPKKWQERMRFETLTHSLIQ